MQGSTVHLSCALRKIYTPLSCRSVWIGMENAAFMLPMAAGCRYCGGIFIIIVLAAADMKSELPQAGQYRFLADNFEHGIDRGGLGSAGHGQTQWNGQLWHFQPVGFQDLLDQG